MHRHELSDAQYARLETLLPQPRHDGNAGRPWLPHHMVINGVAMIVTAYVMAPIGMEAMDALQSLGLELDKGAIAEDHQRCVGKPQALVQQPQAKGLG